MLAVVNIGSSLDRDDIRFVELLFANRQLLAVAPIGDWRPVQVVQQLHKNVELVRLVWRDSKPLCSQRLGVKRFLQEPWRPLQETAFPGIPRVRIEGNPETRCPKQQASDTQEATQGHIEWPWDDLPFPQELIALLEQMDAAHLFVRPKAAPDALP